MHEKKLENILSMSAEERYDYFIRRVADFEEVWGLFNNGWASFSEGENLVLPFWPEAEFAERCSVGKWEGFKATAISLDDFVERWIPGMIKDKRKLSVFYIEERKGNVVIDPKDLREDLEEELKKYE